jgi:hypothetical protein
MTGGPAETWKKFTFTSTPPWAFLFGVLVARLMSRRAFGYLPLTRASVNKLRLVRWGSAGVLLSTIPLWILASVILSNSSEGSVGAGVGVLLFLVTLLTFFGGLVAFLIVRQAVGPTGKVMEQQVGQYDSLVEIRRVHPAFVAAVQQHQHARAAGYAYAPQGQPPQ